MHRRTILTSAAGALSAFAGCGTARSLFDPGDPNTHDEYPARRVTLAAVDDVPDEFGVSIDVELLEDTVVPDHTARLRVATTNTGERRLISVADEQCCLFNRLKGRSDAPRGLWLYRDGIVDGLDRRGERWTLDRPADEPYPVAAYGCLPATYAPGETVRNEYHVWDDYQVEGYMEPGTYRWEEPVQVWPPDAESFGDAEPSHEFTWGFDLRVEAIGGM